MLVLLWIIEGHCTIEFKGFVLILNEITILFVFVWFLKLESDYGIVKILLKLIEVDLS